MSLFQAPAVAAATPTYLRYENVSNCCGAGWMCYFPEPTYKYDDWGNRIEGTLKISDEKMKLVKQDLEIITKKLYSLTLIVLTDKQKKYYEPCIKEYGFKPIIKNVYHTYAGNLLTVYAKKRYMKKKDGSYVDSLTGMIGKDPSEFDDEEYPDYD